jgi:hypothetical protein
LMGTNPLLSPMLVALIQHFVTGTFCIYVYRSHLTDKTN